MCQENHQQFMECDRSCSVNAGVSNRLSTSFLLKYHDGRQWGLHATTDHEEGDWMGEYRGEMVSREEGERRKRGKIATTPSYLLQVGPRYLDAEYYGNALRFVNHVCVAPNCRYEQVWVEGRLHVSVIALRAIQVGEELTVSYCFDRMIGSACHCGHEFCQNFMGPAVWRIPNTNRKIPRTVVQVPHAWAETARHIRSTGPTPGVQQRSGRFPEEWQPFTVVPEAAVATAGEECAAA